MAEDQYEDGDEAFDTANLSDDEEDTENNIEVGQKLLLFCYSNNSKITICCLFSNSTEK